MSANDPRPNPHVAEPFRSILNQFAGTAIATSGAMKWQAAMIPSPARETLDAVAKWYVDVWEWRTAELNAGRGTPYDYNPEYRVNRSVIRTKFPWLTLQDETDLVATIRKERKRRSGRAKR